MYPRLPIELLQNQESKKIDDSFSAKKEQSKQQSTLVVVDEQPPKVQDIKLISKSPVIDIFYKEMHFVGKIFLKVKSMFCKKKKC